MATFPEVSVVLIDASDISCIVPPIKCYADLQYVIHRCPWQQGQQSTLVSFVDLSLHESSPPGCIASYQAIFDGGREIASKWSQRDSRSTEFPWEHEVFRWGGFGLRPEAAPSFSCRILASAGYREFPQNAELWLVSFDKSGGLFFHHLPKTIPHLYGSIENESRLAPYMEPYSGMLVGITQGPTGTKSIELYSLD